MDEWTKVIEKGGEVHTIYMDFMKAFDTVPHRRLLGKLYSYGVRGKVLKWMESFLTGRRQRVMVNGTGSAWQDVISGIPQGSVLRPSFFVIYINDLPETVASSVWLFADDTKLYKSIEEAKDTEELQTDLGTWRIGQTSGS